jgi:hypothetical protein
MRLDYSTAEKRSIHVVISQQQLFSIEHHILIWKDANDAPTYSFDHEASHTPVEGFEPNRHDAICQDQLDCEVEEVSKEHRDWSPTQPHGSMSFDHLNAEIWPSSMGVTTIREITDHYICMADRHSLIVDQSEAPPLGITLRRRYSASVEWLIEPCALNPHVLGGAEMPGVLPSWHLEAVVIRSPSALQVPRRLGLLQRGIPRHPNSALRRVELAFRKTRRTGDQALALAHHQERFGGSVLPLSPSLSVCGCSRHVSTQTLTVHGNTQSTPNGAALSLPTWLVLQHHRQSERRNS